MDVENPITVCVPSEIKEIDIVSQNATVTKNSNCQFTVKPEMYKSVELKVVSINKNDTIVHGSYQYRVIEIPSPSAYIGNFSLYEGREIFKSKLNSNPIVFAKMDDSFIYEIKANVTGYSISYKKNDVFIDHTIQGNRIPEDILLEILELEEGSKIYISDIIVNIQGKSRKIQGGNFILK